MDASTSKSKVMEYNRYLYSVVVSTSAVAHCSFLAHTVWESSIVCVTTGCRKWLKAVTIDKGADSKQKEVAQSCRPVGAPMCQVALSNSSSGMMCMRGADTSYRTIVKTVVLLQCFREP
jgi:hypothetical protein